MHPTHTSYFLASSPADYKACHVLQRVLQLKDTLAFPTVYAQRDNQLIGFLSTSTQTGAVCAGPLALDPQLSQPVFTAMRLIEVYEMILREAGITRYLFGINKTQADWKTVVMRLGLTPYNETTDSWWFAKDL